MNIIMNARHMDVTNSLKEYVEAKAGKLSRFYDNVHTVEVTVEREADHALVEMIARAKKKATFVATQRDDDMYACVDQCVDKVVEQLRRHKDRVRSHQGPAHGTLV